MTDDDLTPAPHDDDELPTGMPVFGRSPEGADDRKVRTFGIEVEQQVPAERGKPAHLDRHVESFRAYFDLDGGAVLGLMNARGAMRQANATAVLLGTSLDDLDGVPVEWSPPVEPEYDDDGNVLYLLNDDEPSPADADDPDAWLTTEPVTAAGAKREPAYLDWRGDLVTTAELRFDPLTDGSSRRRFQYLMDSPRYRVRVEALNDIAEWLMGEVGTGGPTRQPSPSGRGRRSTARTSRARSR